MNTDSRNEGGAEQACCELLTVYPVGSDDVENEEERQAAPR